jgi:hypothetical protein
MKSINRGIAPDSCAKKATGAEARRCATLRVNGTGCRAVLLPKVRTSFEDAHGFWEVRILENLEDFFEDAHPFPRCARKVSTFEGIGIGTQECGDGRLKSLVLAWNRSRSSIG